MISRDRVLTLMREAAKRKDSATFDRLQRVYGIRDKTAAKIWPERSPEFEKLAKETKR